MVTAKRDFTSTRSERGGGSPSFLYRLAREIRADERIATLSPAQRYALIHAVEKYADIEGEWFLSYRRWASETDVSRRSLQYMVARCESTGLLKVIDQDYFVESD